MVLVVVDEMLPEPVVVVGEMPVSMVRS